MPEVVLGWFIFMEFAQGSASKEQALGGQSSQEESRRRWRPFLLAVIAVIYLYNLYTIVDRFLRGDNKFRRL